MPITEHYCQAITGTFPDDDMSTEAIKFWTQQVCDLPARFCLTFGFVQLADGTKRDIHHWVCADHYDEFMNLPEIREWNAL